MNEGAKHEDREEEGCAGKRELREKKSEIKIVQVKECGCARKLQKNRIKIKEQRDRIQENGEQWTGQE